MLGTVLLLELAQAISIVGVAPADQHLYKPDSEGFFTCLGDPSIRIPFNQVNDDYCDCPDGSDEPGTSACSNGRFWCQGSEQYIPSRIVGDGVCDYEMCCDGSDESPGLCDNRCAEIKAIQEERRKAELDYLKEGSRLREEMEQKAILRKKELESNLESLKDEISVTQTLISRLKEDLTVAEREDMETNADPESTQAIAEVRDALKESDQYIDLLHSRFSDLKKAYRVLFDTLETMSSDYNPNFNDPAVKDAIKAWKAQTPPELSLPASQDLQISLAKLDTIKVAKPTDTLEQTMYSGWRSIVKNLLPPIISKQFGSTSQLALKTQGLRAKKILEEIAEADAKVSELESSLELDSKLLAVNADFWGPNEIGRSAENLCVAVTRGDFKYEICLFGTAVQLDGYNSVRLGHSTGLGVNESIEFIDGDRCPDGSLRSLSLLLECGHSTEAYSVEEPSVCHYVAKAKSPIVCRFNDESLEGINHDEL